MSNKLTIVGLGPGDMDKLSLKAYKVLQDAGKLYLRTEKHPLVEELKREGIKFQTFDHIYDKAETFDEVYNVILKVLNQEAEAGDVVYAVPGHPLVAEKTVESIIELSNEKYNLEIVGSESFLDAVFIALRIDPINGIKVIDGLQLDKQPPALDVGNIITQVYNQMVASEVKLSLMDHYPSEQLITVIRGAGIKGEEKIEEIPLFALDRVPWIDYLTTIYVPPVGNKGNLKGHYPLDPLVDVLAALRAENGCPWDREQTHLTLKRYLLEESYEVLEAVDDEDMHKLCEELGDLLLQIIFHAQIAREADEFDINDVIAEVTEKMIRRHPHVFGSVKAETSKEVEVNWEAIKKQEKGQEGGSQVSVLDGVPKGMSALLTADKLQAKAARVGFDWPDYQGPLAKVEEEIDEVKEAILLKDSTKISSELGDLLFSVVNLSRSLKISPEEVLINANRKFIRRFSYIEQESSSQGLNLQEMTLEEMDNLWMKAKENGF